MNIHIVYILLSSYESERVFSASERPGSTSKKEAVVHLDISKPALCFGVHLGKSLESKVLYRGKILNLLISL